MTIQIGVVGGSEATEQTESGAELIGAALASAGAVVVCGGLGGVMAAACRGAKSAGGLTVGLLPGRDPAAANPWVEVVVPTGLGEARNALVVSASSAVIAVGGAYGTLSEIALALRWGIPVIGVGTWALHRPDGGRDRGIVAVADPAAAAVEAIRLARRTTGPTPPLP
ncbi:MAG: TIGR00725 family protein [Acidimicrobiales bacterium]